MTLPPITGLHRLTCPCGAVEMAVTFTGGLSHPSDRKA